MFPYSRFKLEEGDHILDEERHSKMLHAYQVLSGICANIVLFTNLHIHNLQRALISRILLLSVFKMALLQKLTDLQKHRRCNVVVTLAFYLEDSRHFLESEYKSVAVHANTSGRNVLIKEKIGNEEKALYHIVPLRSFCDACMLSSLFLSLFLCSLNPLLQKLSRNKNLKWHCHSNFHCSKELHRVLCIQ